MHGSSPVGKSIIPHRRVQRKGTGQASVAERWVVRRPAPVLDFSFQEAMMAGVVTYGECCALIEHDAGVLAGGGTGLLPQAIDA